jgi:AcrR family transcriptional regulator
MLDAAERSFAAHGFAGVSMDGIAEEVGVSKPMLYAYFGSKEGLLTACVDRARAELQEATRLAAAQADSPRDAMWRGLLAYFTFAEGHARAWSVLLQEPMLSGAPIEDMRRRQSELIIPIMTVFAPGAARRALEAYAEIIVGACERVALWRTRTPEVTATDAAGYVMDLIWTGIGASLPG